MKPLAAPLLALATLGGGSAWAQEALPSAEPKVERLVHEDEGSRIEELRVRGAVQRIVVTPKVGPKKGYEIITGDGSRDLGDGVNTSRGAAGRRVWHILSF